jgi:hypothetical protein
LEVIGEGFQAFRLR